MHLQNAELFLRTPGMLRRIDAVVDGLRGDQSVIVVASARFPEAAILGRVRLLLERFDHSVTTISLEEGGSGSPEETLGAYFGCDKSGFTEPWPLPDDLALPEFVFLENLGGLPAMIRRRWLHFVGSWAKAIRRVGPGRLPHFAAIVARPEDLPLLPRSELGVDVQPWWAIGDSVDVAALTRHFALEQEDRRRLWREFIIASLTTWDAELAAALWGNVDAGPEEIVGALVEMARERKVAEEEARQAIDAALLLASGEALLPREEMSAPWLDGLLERSVEFGVEASVLAHAALGDTGEILHRLWRGQAKLILPRIDKLRMLLCRSLNETHGPEWVEWAECEDERERVQMVLEPASVQIGHLKRIVDCSKSQVGLKAWEWVRAAHAVRNEIAHGRAISFIQYVDLERRAERLRRELARDFRAQGVGHTTAFAHSSLSRQVG